MKRFIVLFATLITLLIAGCIPFLSGATWPNTPGERRDQPVHVNIDKDFSVQQRKWIAQAMDAWEIASSGKVKFQPVWDVSKPGPFQQIYPFNWSQGIFMWDLPKDPYNLSPSQLEQAKPLGGLTIYGPGQNAAHVIVYTDVPDKLFYAVALHELGHLIGLNHIDGKAVMHKNVKAQCITALDAQQLCEIYGCKPKPNCD
ncbi:MAG TPA: matrixin family metalloprotease [Anaerovoracaceae bacterium]|nr:matrixin family metalloprotease [Anaerovoracaceae bacterium]